jgi:hypothetical protein
MQAVDTAAAPRHRMVRMRLLGRRPQRPPDRVEGVLVLGAAPGRDHGQHGRRSLPRRLDARPRAPVGTGRASGRNGLRHRDRLGGPKAARHLRPGRRTEPAGPAGREVSAVGTPAVRARLERDYGRSENRVSWRPAGPSRRLLRECHGVGVGSATTSAPATASLPVADTASPTWKATRMCPARRGRTAAPLHSPARSLPAAVRIPQVRPPWLISRRCCVSPHR